MYLGQDCVFSNSMYVSGAFPDCNQMLQTLVSFVWLEGGGSHYQIPAKPGRNLRLSCCSFLCDCCLHGKPKTKNSKQWTRLNFVQHKFSPKTATAETQISVFSWQFLQYEHQHLHQFANREVQCTQQLRQWSTRWSTTSLKRVSGHSSRHMSAVHHKKFDY